MSKEIGQSFRYGKTVAVIGGGPAGSFCAYLLARKGVKVDIFEPRPYIMPNKLQHCTGCAGWLQKDSLNLLSSKGLELPPNVIQAQIDRAVVYLPEGEITGLKIEGTTIYRGFGPINQTGYTSSLDAYLLENAVRAGAVHHQAKVIKINIRSRDVEIVTEKDEQYVADIAIGAFGHNPKLMEAITYPKNCTPLDMPFIQKASVREYFLGKENVEKLLGKGVYIFADPTPSIWFAAIVPKREYFSVVLMNRKNVEPKFFDEFFQNPQVTKLLGQNMVGIRPHCACLCNITVQSPKSMVVQSKENKILMVNIGDAGPTRPRKNGIFAALDSASHLSDTLLSLGNSAKSFEAYRRYMNRNYVKDNSYSEFYLSVFGWVMNQRIARRIITYLVQHDTPLSPAVKRIMRQLITGDAPYWTIPGNAFKALFIKPRSEKVRPSNG